MSSATETLDMTDLTVWWRERLGYPTQPMKIELHLHIYHSCEDDERKEGGLRNDFARRWAQKIEALGGEWSKRPTINDSHRYVTLPASYAGIALAGELIAADRRSDSERGISVVIRGLPVWSTRYGDASTRSENFVLRGVKNVEDLCAKAAREIADHVNRGWIVRVDQLAKLEADQREAEAKRQAEAKERERVAKLHAAGPKAIAALQALLPHVAGIASHHPALVLAREAFAEADVDFPA